MIIKKKVKRQRQKYGKLTILGAAGKDNHCRDAIFEHGM